MNSRDVSNQEPDPSRPDSTKTVPGQESKENPPVDWQGLTEVTDPNNPVVPSERPDGSLHSPHPDARDEEKVERLAAPDWRNEQPLPSARNAIDPRGENAPAELFEPPEDKNQET